MLPVARVYHELIYNGNPVTWSSFFLFVLDFCFGFFNKHIVSGALHKHHFASSVCNGVFVCILNFTIACCLTTTNLAFLLVLVVIVKQQSCFVLCRFTPPLNPFRIATGEGVFFLLFHDFVVELCLSCPPFVSFLMSFAKGFATHREW